MAREFRPWNEYAKHIRAELDRQSLWPLDVREHSLESARSGDINPEPAFAAYLQTLHAGHAPDLIVAIGAPAANFIQRHRQQLFPTAPAPFTAIDQRRIDYSSLTGNDALVAVRHNFRVNGHCEDGRDHNPAHAQHRAGDVAVFHLGKSPFSTPALWDNSRWVSHAVNCRIMTHDIWLFRISVVWCVTLTGALIFMLIA
jgi:hypothetical protein